MRNKKKSCVVYQWCTIPVISLSISCSACSYKTCIENKGEKARLHLLQENFEVRGEYRRVQRSTGEYKEVQGSTMEVQGSTSEVQGEY